MPLIEARTPRRRQENATSKGVIATWLRTRGTERRSSATGRPKRVTTRREISTEPPAIAPRASVNMRWATVPKVPPGTQRLRTTAPRRCTIAKLQRKIAPRRPRTAKTPGSTT